MRFGGTRSRHRLPRSCRCRSMHMKTTLSLQVRVEYSSSVSSRRVVVSTFASLDITAVDKSMSEWFLAQVDRTRDVTVDLALPCNSQCLIFWTFGERKHSARQWLVMTSLMTELWKMKNSACLAGYLFTFYRLNGKKSKSLIHYWGYPVLTLPRPLSMIRHIHPLRYVHVYVFTYV